MGIKPKNGYSKGGSHDGCGCIVLSYRIDNSVDNLPSFFSRTTMNEKVDVGGPEPVESADIVGSYFCTTPCM